MPRLTLGSRLAAVRERIAAAAPDPDRVRLVAVTKGFGPDVVRAALAAGLVDVGRELRPGAGGQGGEIDAADARDGAPRPRWHFIGRLQRNKVRKAAPLVALWHSVDRLSLGAEIARAGAGGRGAGPGQHVRRGAEGRVPPDEAAGAGRTGSATSASTCRGSWRSRRPGPPRPPARRFTRRASCATGWGWPSARWA